MIPVLKKPKKIDNYKFAVGFGMNWADLDKGVMYHIQDYKEAIDRGENPKGIKMTSLSDGRDLGTADPILVEQKMKDPGIDPRYAPETPKEHRHNW